MGRWYVRPPFADTVSRLAAYRGITHLGALSLAAEVCDWRRFGTAGTFMAFTGLTPSEHSSGERTRRGPITHAGNVHLRTQLRRAGSAFFAEFGAAFLKKREKA